MASKESNCPACGAPIISAENASFRCDYCGAYFISNIENGLDHVKWVGSEVSKDEQQTDQSPLVIKSPVKPAVVSTGVRPVLPINNHSSNPSNTDKPGVKSGIRNIVLVGILGLLFLCIIMMSSAISNSSKPTKNLGVNLSPTITPTPYLISLPHSFSSSKGWKYKVTKIQVSTSIGDLKPEQDYFLIAVMEIKNLTGEYNCLKMEEFTSYDDSKKIDMEYRALKAAQNKFSIDYPGGILGQCLGSDSTEKSVLVFDVPNSQNEWFINFQDKTVKIGKLDTIQNPPPTATPSPSPTPTITNTPTITPTSQPSGSVNAAVGSYINVRSGPGVNFPIAFKLEGQATFSILNRNEQSDWYFIQTESGDRGWVRNDLIEATIEATLLSISTEVIPTLTPAPTNTPTPRPTVAYSIQAPKGTWCAQNNTRGFCVSGIEYKTYIGYTSASANGRFITLGVGVKNISLFDISVNPFDFTMVMEDGRTYEHASETYYYNNALQAVEVSPGNSATGALVFYVPNDVGPRKIICRGGFLESTIEIDLYDKPKD